MARTVARIALRTEAQPLMPHAQGIVAGLRLATSARPNGKGNPIQKANGAMRTRVAVILATLDPTARAVRATRGPESPCPRCWRQPGQWLCSGAAPWWSVRAG